MQVTVGDRADVEKVRNENPWSENFPVQWHRVPDELGEKHGYFGTSDFRYLLPKSKARAPMFQRGKSGREFRPATFGTALESC